MSADMMMIVADIDLSSVIFVFISAARGIVIIIFIFIFIFIDIIHTWHPCPHSIAPRRGRLALAHADRKR